MLVSLLLLFSLNVADAVMTLLQSDKEGFKELNPIAEVFLGLGPIFFLAFKVLVVGACCCVVWKHRKYTLAKVLTGVAVGVYVSIVIWHVVLLYYIPNLC